MRITMCIERSKSTIVDTIITAAAGYVGAMLADIVGKPSPQPDHGGADNEPPDHDDRVARHRATVESCARFVRGRAASLRVDARHAPPGSERAGTQTAQADMLESVADMMLPAFGHFPAAAPPVAMDPERSSSAV